MVKVQTKLLIFKKVKKRILLDSIQLFLSLQTQLKRCFSEIDEITFFICNLKKKNNLEGNYTVISTALEYLKRIVFIIEIEVNFYSQGRAAACKKNFMVIHEF